VCEPTHSKGNELYFQLTNVKSLEYTKKNLSCMVQQYHESSIVLVIHYRLNQKHMMFWVIRDNSCLMGHMVWVLFIDKKMKTQPTSQTTHILFVWTTDLHMFKICGTVEARSDTLWNACVVNVHLVGYKAV